MTTQHFLISAWDWNPWIIGTCVLAILVHSAWYHFHFNRNICWLLLGMAVLFLTLGSPIDALANGYLFSAHMLQHLLLLLVVPPLILLSLPPAPVTESPQSDRLKWLSWIFSYPLNTWLLGVGGMWLWHAPTLCNAAVANVWVHRLQYMSLLAMGFAFWVPILGLGNRQRLSPLAGIIYLSSACLGCTVLGIIITFSPVEVCSIYLHPLDRLGILPLIQNQWGLTPSKDQQLGGLLMWVPACLIYFSGIMGLFVRWHGEIKDEAVISNPEPTKALMERSHGQ
jgi:putative membrane protein